LAGSFPSAPLLNVARKIAEENPAVSEQFSVTTGE
jgi:hypothetical protein